MHNHVHTSQISQCTTYDGTSRPCSIRLADPHSSGGCNYLIPITLITDKASCWTRSGAIVVTHCGCIECSVLQYNTPNTFSNTTWILSCRIIQWTNIIQESSISSWQVPKLCLVTACEVIIQLKQKTLWLHWLHWPQRHTLGSCYTMYCKQNKKWEVPLVSNKHLLIRIL